MTVATWPRRAIGLLALLLTLSACQTTDIPTPATPRADDLATLQARAVSPTPAPPTAGQPGTTVARPSTTRVPATATPPPTVSPSPAPPTPTPGPLVRAQADLADGDYDAAVAGLRALLAANPAPDDAKTARFRLGQALLFQGDDPAARAELAAFVQAYPADALTPAALFMLGRIAYDAKEWDAAADAYGQYVRLGGPLADYAQNRVGNSLNSARRFADAATAYTAAVQMPGASAPILRAAWHGLGDSREGLGDMDGARDAYTRAFQAATDDEDRAAAVFALYLLATKLDQAEAARREVERLWTQYPDTQAAYQAAQADADDDDPRLLYLKGKVAYARGDWRMTVTALNQAATDDPAHPADTHLFAGEAYRRLGQTRQAVFHYDQLIDTHPGDPQRPDALLGKARALRTSDSEAALAAYDRFLAQYPAHAEADRAALEAARLVETSEDCQTALPRYQAAADRYASDAGLDARARLGLCQMHGRDTAGATATWQALTGTTLPDRQAQGLFWLGRLAEAGDAQRAAALYRQAQAAAPRGFYGVLATLALQQRPTPTTSVGAGLVPAPQALSLLGRRDWSAAEKWLLDKTSRTPADLAQAEGAVRGDADLARARAFVEQGLRDTAQRHLRLVRAHVGDDPLRLYWLARYADALGQYTVSLSLAEALSRALDTPLAALPAPLQALAFPTPYPDLVEAAVRQQGVDPALLWAVMRQESRFEPGVTSTAGARGLMQVVPSTGQSIARALGDDDFTPADLYRPSVNIEFGAYYLAQQLRRFDGQLWAALAAYNAGPNAVPPWRAASDDWALQIEAIDYPETATYVRRVLEYWGYYAGLGSRE